MRPDDRNAYEADIQDKASREQKTARLLIRGLQQFAVDPSPDVPVDLHAKIMARAAAMPPLRQKWVGRAASWVETAWRVPVLVKVTAVATVCVAIVVYSMAHHLSGRLAQQQVQMEKLQAHYQHTLQQLTTVKGAHDRLRTQVVAQSSLLRQTQFQVTATWQQVRRLQTGMASPEDALAPTRTQVMSGENISPSSVAQSPQEVPTDTFGVFGGRSLPKTTLGTF